MKYKNPRLKIVKKIEYLCSKVKNDKNNTVTVEMILEQCNLLLETKKKKCEHGVRFLKDSETGKTTDWTTCKQCKPSPQPEIQPLSEIVKRTTTDREFVLCVAEKVDELVERVNKLTKTK